MMLRMMAMGGFAIWPKDGRTGIVPFMRLNLPEPKSKHTAEPKKNWAYKETTSTRKRITWPGIMRRTFLGLIRRIQMNHQQRFLELPPDLRQRAITALREMFDPSVEDDIKAEYDRSGEDWWLDANIHFHWGMSIRNFLREQGILDNQLPSSNWDDYYLQIIEAAVHIRDDKTGNVVYERNPL